MVAGRVCGGGHGPRGEARLAGGGTGQGDTNQEQHGGAEAGELHEGEGAVVGWYWHGRPDAGAAAEGAAAEGSVQDTSLLSGFHQYGAPAAGSSTRCHFANIAQGVQRVKRVTGVKKR